jgi:hypothetical protein
MEKELKSQVVQAAEAIKRKVQELRMMESDKEKILNTVFQPITKPLHQIIHNNHAKTSNETKDFDTKKESFDTKYDNNLSSVSQNLNYDNKSPKFQEDISDDVSDEDFDTSNIDNSSNTSTSFRTVESLTSPNKDDSSWSVSSEIYDDVPYGVRRERGKLMIGTKRVHMHDDKILIGSNDYTKTPGLCELLFKKVPNENLVTATDKQAYKTILIESNAHRRDYDSNKQIKANRGQKYLRIIKPLFKLRKPSTSSVSSTVSTGEYVSEGEGLTLKKKLNKNTDYVYWDDPNELVERLKLLIASKDAGNTGLDNEIISIVEELRESGIIN